MYETWQRIERWLARNAPVVMQSLRAGAADREIADTEVFLDVTFPDDVRASFRVHDGQSGSTASFGFSPGLIDGWELLSLATMRDQWQAWKDLLDGGEFDDTRSEPRGPILTDWWHPCWIPLTHDGSGNHHMLDLNPAPGGAVGQIIEFVHDDSTRTVVAANFATWLTQFANDLDAGEYVYDDALESLWRREDVE